ncbi:MAG TPA: pseudouridine synthase [Candidatus Methylomirabilis sp.]|nr:pseudouridine synthase [Candidatus Methylomirabilis sp.]
MITQQEKIIYPVIINKYLALKKISSRKEADRLLRAGRIKVNGKRGEPGQMIKQGDKVEVDLLQKNLVYLAFNKPRGIITHSPQAGERSIADILKYRAEKVWPVGRLDKMSSGLIILTNDGRVTDKLLNPNFFHEKEYEVDVDRPLTPEFIKKIAQGVKLDDGYVTKKCRVKKIRDKTFLIILTEGKKHQIRRMCEALGRKAVDLHRLRIMNIGLRGLRAGQYRLIIDAELREFLTALNLY